MDQHSKITEADSRENKIVTSQWCNLSNHLLSQIFTERLELKELLKIRGVCKDWKCASSEALAHIESSQCEPWFLMYGEGSKCSLLSNEDKLYTITCLASNGGWLLLFCQDSMFFFCPFSRAKIDLPKCPSSELSNCFDHIIAVFSSAPTSQDCMVVVKRRWHEIVLQLYLIYRGDEQWSEHEYLCTIGDLSTIKPATYRDGVFQVSDGFFGSVTFDARTKKWRRHVEVSSMKKYMKCKISRLCFWPNNLREKLGLEANVSSSTCGTLIPHFDELDILIQNEDIQGAEGSQSRQLKGVWIQPRFFKIPQDHRW